MSTLAPLSIVQSPESAHATPDKPRTIIGQSKRPCDLVFALRLHYDYTPAEALEIPIELAEAYVGATGKLSWTQKLARAPAVAHLDAAQLARGDPHSAGLILHGSLLALLARSGRVPGPGAVYPVAGSKRARIDSRVLRTSTKDAERMLAELELVWA